MVHVEKEEKNSRIIFDMLGLLDTIVLLDDLKEKHGNDRNQNHHARIINSRDGDVDFVVTDFWTTEGKAP